MKTLSRNLFKSGLSAVLSLAGYGTYAQAQRLGPVPYPAPIPVGPVPAGPIPLSQCHTQSTRIVSVRQYFNNGGDLALRQLLGLGQECRGMRIQKVLLVASSRAGYGQATVLVNDRPATQPMGLPAGRTTLVSSDLDWRFNDIGNSIQTLRIDLRGSIYVDSVGVILEMDPWAGVGGPNPGPGPRPNPPGPGPGYGR